MNERIVLIKSGGDGMNFGLMHKEYLIKDASDVANLPTDCAQGSMAYTADIRYMYTKDTDGTWVRVGGWV